MRKMATLTAIVAVIGLVCLTSGPAISATITVDTTTDELNADGDCSLREAIQAANTDTVVDACVAGSGADTINVPAGTYTLTSSAGGDLDIVTDDLTISGAGAATTIIDGGGSNRVFNVTAVTVMFSDLTIRNGMDPRGGGIRNFGGTVEVYSSIVIDNTATDAGGGIFNNGGTLTVTNSTVIDNMSVNDGAGIRTVGGMVEVINSTVHGNMADDDGAGIGNNGGMVTLINSTVSDNTAVGNTNFGGGIFNTGSGTLTAINSTFSGNTADEEGGGIRNNSGSTVTLSNSTLTANTAGTEGGGIRNLGTVNIQNTIIAGNTAPTGPDCSSNATITSLGDNLVGDDTACKFSATTGDQVGTSGSPIDPLLDALADNGGPTETHALLAGSPAIDAGNPAGCKDPDGDLLTTDQRGVARPQGVDCDIGAYEFHPLITVDIKFISDPNGFNCKKKGVMPVTIFGDLDVTDIDISSLMLEREDGMAGDDSVSMVGPPLSSKPPHDRGNPEWAGISDDNLDVVTGVELDTLSNPVEVVYNIVGNTTDLFAPFGVPDQDDRDGFLDLDVGFDAQQVAKLIGCSTLNKGDLSPVLILTGELNDGKDIISVPTGDPGADQLTKVNK